MTRINVVLPSELVDKHLIAEWKEISRILTQARKPNKNEKWPETYRMGTGHMKFFYIRLAYIEWRYRQLYSEMKSRKFNANYEMMESIIAKAKEIHSKDMWYHYIPTPTALIINRKRLAKRLGITYDEYLEKYYAYKATA